MACLPTSLRAAPAALLAACALAACATRGPGSGSAPRPTVPAAPPLPVVTEADLDYLRARRLAVPVAGVRAASIPNSFDAPRDGGRRVHNAIDVLAPRGTPILSADDGRIWKLRTGGVGGITIYALDPGERLVYYYAHLDRYRDGLTEGALVHRGDTLGFVGTTGNAPPDVPHLHFQVARLGADRRWWAGAPIDPLPFLREQERAVQDAAVRAVAGDGRRVTAQPAVARAGTPRTTPDGAPLRPTVPVAPPDDGAAADASRPDTTGTLALPTIPAGPPPRRTPLPSTPDTP